MIYIFFNITVMKLCGKKKCLNKNNVKKIMQKKKKINGIKIGFAVFMQNIISVFLSFLYYGVKYILA